MGWFRGETAPVPIAPTQTLTDRYRGVLEEFSTASRHASAVISPTAFSALRRIDDTMRPLIDDLEGKRISPEHQLDIEQIIGQFAPDTLTLFLGLPASEQSEGARGDTLLIDQLRALERAARELAATIRGDAFTALETNAIFLKEALR